MSPGATSVFVLLGPPGSGKGTQAARLHEAHPDWLHVSTGNLFRAEIASGSELGNSVKSILKDGNLVSDEVTNEVFSFPGIEAFR
jgi:adenylate kinase